MITKYILDDKEWAERQRIRFIQNIFVSLCLVVVILFLWGSYFCLSRLFGTHITFSINVSRGWGVNLATAEGLMMGVGLLSLLGFCLTCAYAVGRFLYLFLNNRLDEL